jgi:hypothetical protein
MTQKFTAGLAIIAVAAPTNHRSAPIRGRGEAFPSTAPSRRSADRVRPAGQRHSARECFARSRQPPRPGRGIPTKMLRGMKSRGRSRLARGDVISGNAAPLQSRPRTDPATIVAATATQRRPTPIRGRGEAFPSTTPSRISADRVKPASHRHRLGNASPGRGSLPGRGVAFPQTPTWDEVARAFGATVRRCRIRECRAPTNDAPGGSRHHRRCGGNAAPTGANPW